MKNILDGINGRVDKAEEKTSKLKGLCLWIEIIQTETQREKEQNDNNNHVTQNQW